MSSENHRVRIAVLLAIAMPALLFGQGNTTAPSDKAPLQAKLSGTDITAKLEAIAELEGYLLNLPALDKAAQNTWLPLLISLLQDQDGTVSSQATELLKKLGRKFGAPVVDALLATLQNPHAMTRYLAAEALGAIGDKRAIAPLLKLMLEDKDVYARGSAASALGNLRAKEAVEPLAKLLATQSRPIRYARISAAYALGKIGGQQALDPLLKALQDTEDYVRYAAAEALGEIEDCKAVEPLVNCVLHDTNISNRQMAVRSLLKLGDKLPKLNFRPYQTQIQPYLTSRTAALASCPSPIPNISLTVEGPRLAYRYKPSEYQIEITNEGDGPLDGGQLIFPLLCHDYVASNQPAHWNSVTRVVTWNLPSILAKKKLALAVQIRDTSGGRRLLPFKLRWKGLETVANIEVDVLTCWSGPLFRTTDTNDPIRVWETTMYIVTVENFGGPDCTNIQVADVLPDEMEYLNAYVQGQSKIKAAVEGQKIVFASIPHLRDGEKITYCIECRAIKSGYAYNRAILRYDQFTREIFDIEGTAIYK